MFQNYELLVSSFIANGEGVNATVSIRARAFPCLAIFNLEVFIPRCEPGTIDFYESEAIKKAAEIISVVNDDINEAA